MKVIIESLTNDEINEFLMSDQVLQISKNSNDSRTICMKILSECGKLYSESTLPKLKTTTIYKVNKDNTIDILSSNHTVLSYDGYFYDYYPQEFKESFEDDISKVIPVIQRIISSENSVTRFDSNIKGYSIVEGSDNK